MSQTCFAPFDIDQLTNVTRHQYDRFFHLRMPAKNMVTQYNAIHKVFHARYDEMRSLVFIHDFAHVEQKQPVISAARVSAEKLLAKNTHAMLRGDSKKIIIHRLRETSPSLRSLYPSFEFPFLLSLKSDSARFM
jgi:hypothetical protein